MCRSIYPYSFTTTITIRLEQRHGAHFKVSKDAEERSTTNPAPIDSHIYISRAIHGPNTTHPNNPLHPPLNSQCNSSRENLRLPTPRLRQRSKHLPESQCRQQHRLLRPRRPRRPPLRPPKLLLRLPRSLHLPPLRRRLLHTQTQTSSKTSFPEFGRECSS